MKARRKKEDQVFLKKIMAVSLAIIVVASFEALFYAKDINFYTDFSKVYKDLSYSQYINLILFNMILAIINPMIISLYTFFTIDRIRINQIYKIFFCFSTFISLMHTLFQFRLNSITYYLVIILNIILFIVIVKKERTD